MPGILDGKLAGAIYAGFKGRLLRGTLRLYVASGAPDALGDVTTAPVDYDCEGFGEHYSAAYRERAGIPKTDLKVCIFSKSLPAGVEPLQDGAVRFEGAGPFAGVWYVIRDVGTDPAGALWECQSYEKKGG